MFMIKIFHWDKNIQTYLYYDSELVFSIPMQGAYFILPCFGINWLSLCPLGYKLSEDPRVNLALY